MSIIIKLGAAPLHFWFPNIIDGLNWTNCLIIMTWQKLTPLTIISYCNKTNFIIFFIVISSIIGALGGLNQSTLRKILAFSSINHIRWILSALIFNNLRWIYYFLFYFIINFSIVSIFKLFNLFNINQIYLFNSKKHPLLKFCFFFNFLSLGGLPPFLGFLPKWIIIENLIGIKNIFILIILIIFTIITLFFYIRLRFSRFLIYYPSFSWKLNSLYINNLLIINLLSNFIITFSFFIFLITNFYRL